MGARGLGVFDPRPLVPPLILKIWRLRRVVTAIRRYSRKTSTAIGQ